MRLHPVRTRPRTSLRSLLHRPSDRMGCWIHSGQNQVHTKCNLAQFTLPDFGGAADATTLSSDLPSHSQGKRLDHFRSRYLTSSLDDDLPDISDLLKCYPRPLSEMGATTSTTPITLPRPSLRSSTFDGKTVYLKRKSRTIGISVRVPEHSPEHSKLQLTRVYSSSQSRQ
jgi:hypothetical protein